MGWFDGFTVTALGALAPAWPGMREHLESALLRRQEDQQQEKETESETDGETPESEES